MTKPLTETVTVTRPVDPRIADLVYFAQEVLAAFAKNRRGKGPITDDELVSMANEYWDRQHGED